MFKIMVATSKSYLATCERCNIVMLSVLWTIACERGQYYQNIHDVYEKPKLDIACILLSFHHRVSAKAIRIYSPLE